MRAALDILLPRAGRARVAVLGDMLELGAEYSALLARSSRWRRGGFGCCDVGPGRPRCRPFLAARATLGRRGRSGRWTPADRPGDFVLVQGCAAWGSRLWHPPLPARRRLVGEVLIAERRRCSSASSLAQVHRVLREREFASRSAGKGRRAPRQGGTPGGGDYVRDHHLHRIAVPFLLLTNRDARSLTVFGVRSRARCSAFAATTEARHAALAGLQADEARVPVLIRSPVAVGVRGRQLGDTLNLRIAMRIRLGYLTLFSSTWWCVHDAAVNLTDGLDGLGGCVSIACSPTLDPFTTRQRPPPRCQLPGARAWGSCGQLVPRRSSWGHGIAGPGRSDRRDGGDEKTEVLSSSSGICVIEALSVLIQGFAFRVRKRISSWPRHPHFELSPVRNEDHPRFGVAQCARRSASPVPARSARPFGGELSRPGPLVGVTTRGQTYGHRARAQPWPPSRPPWTSYGDVARAAAAPRHAASQPALHPLGIPQPPFAEVRRHRRRHRPGRPCRGPPPARGGRARVRGRPRRPRRPGAAEGGRGGGVKAQRETGERQRRH